MKDMNQADWLTPEHLQFLVADAHAQFDFFGKSIRETGGFYVLDHGGSPLETDAQELHTTTRLIHSFALGKLAGREGCEDVIDHGMSYLRTHHTDAIHGGFSWATQGTTVKDGRKLAYGHVFVLLAAASAHAAGHPTALKLLDQVDSVLDEHFWDEQAGLFHDEFNRNWSPFSSYRGMNANMHGIEALLSAYEATGRDRYLERAGRILEFFTKKIAPKENWRFPEHYDEQWNVDRAYSGNPMFRPAGTTPGHSFEIARLLLQYNELVSKPSLDRVATARKIACRALSDAWDVNNGGFVYTLDFNGEPDVKDRYWWPVTEAIGTMSALLKTDATPDDVDWYESLWSFAQDYFIDHELGGWFPEIDTNGVVTEKQFVGKPDIYHSIQAALFPMTSKVSGVFEGLSKGQFLLNSMSS